MGSQAASAALFMDRRGPASGSSSPVHTSSSGNPYQRALGCRCAPELRLLAYEVHSHREPSSPSDARRHHVGTSPVFKRSTADAQGGDRHGAGVNQLVLDQPAMVPGIGG